MSLTNTIAHDGAAPTRGFSFKGIGMMAAGLALGVAIGLTIANNGNAAELPTPVAAPSAGLAYDDFVRVNTTGLDSVTAAAASVPVIESQTAVDSGFIYLNTTALDGVVSAASVPVIESQTAVDSGFIYLNTTALDSPTAPYAENSSGPR